MKSLFPALIIIWLCCNISYGAVFDPYTRRYNIRNASFDGLFYPTAVASTSIQALVFASTKIDNDRCKSIHLYAVRPTLDQLINFQYELIDLCPQLYEAIRGKNITTWGPVDEFLQIWYMKFVDALWKRIATKMPSGRCALYDDFIIAAENDLDSLLFEYLENNYNPELCEVNDQTMREWHLFFQRTEIYNRLTKFLRIGGFSIQLIHAIATAYLTEARYDSYLIGPPYDHIYRASLSMPNFTLTQKSFIKMTYTNLNTMFGTFYLEGRKNYFLMKFCETLDQSFANFALFNSIPLDPLDGITHYHLILYYSRYEFLILKQLQYIVSPTVPTTSAPAITCPTTTTTTPAPPACGEPADGQATIYIETYVNLSDDYSEDNYAGKATPIRTCTNSTKGRIEYYNGTTNAIHTEDWGAKKWVGRWWRYACSQPCICTTTACYTVSPAFPKIDPLLFLLPHCISPNDCFIEVVFRSGDSLFNPLNASDTFTYAAQMLNKDVTTSAYPRVNKIGCTGCPVTA